MRDWGSGVDIAEVDLQHRSVEAAVSFRRRTNSIGNEEIAGLIDLALLRPRISW